MIKDPGEIVARRRAALERIVPGLPIADRCTLTDRFLVVQGRRRTYKIHLGSGYDLALLPAERARTGAPGPEADAAETRLLVVVRDLTGLLPALDEENAEVPPFLCALRLEPLLRAPEPVTSLDDDTELANPRVRS